MKSLNLFKTLSKYGSRAAEDYLTESFVVLMQNLLERRPAAGLRFLNTLCGLTGEVRFDNPEMVLLSTQVAVEAGRPDIQLRSGSDILVYIEVKHDAPLGERQLEYYKEQLDRSDSAHKVLVFLTRSLASCQETTLPRSEYHHICWYDVHRELSALKGGEIGEVCIFLIDEFLTFLEGKQMSLERVGWEYISGVPSLVALINLLEVAILEAAPEMSLRRTGGFSWLGFYLDGKYFCGVRYAEPLVVVFENNLGTDPTYKRDLGLENEHFFSLSQAEQLECLVTYVQDCLANKPEEG